MRYHLIKQIEKTIVDALLTSIESLMEGFSYDEINRLIEKPKLKENGDFSFPCFTLSKKARKKPNIIANELADILSSVNISYISHIKVTGPYINFYFDMNQVFTSIYSHNENNTLVGKKRKNGKKLMVEYSQPNSHKAFHVGHIRNVALGDSISRILDWAGFDVIPVNYFGDVGTHVAKCLWAFEKLGGDTLFSGSFKGEYIGGFYTKANELLSLDSLTHISFLGAQVAQISDTTEHPSDANLQIVKVMTDEGNKQVVINRTMKIGDKVAYLDNSKQLSKRKKVTPTVKGIENQGTLCSAYQLSLSKTDKSPLLLSEEAQVGVDVADLYLKIPLTHSVAEELESRKGEVSQILQRLESGEPDITALWLETRQWSLDSFKEIYAWLGAEFQHDYFESDVGTEGKELVLEYTEKGYFIHSDGAIGIDLNEEGLGFFMLLKSDGTGLYSTKDLALAKRKFDQFNIDNSIHVVDSTQSLHFQQVFKTLEKIGYEVGKNSYHLSYGQVERTDGKMSSRKGNVIYFSQLRDMISQKIRTEYLTKFDGIWTDEKIAETTKKIAVACIRYGMLNTDSKKNIVFDLNEWTKVNGNSGAYLLYTYARIQSIMHQANYQPIPVSFESLTSESETELGRAILGYDYSIEKAADTYEPHYLCLYLYDLAKAYNRFYADKKILNLKCDIEKNSRLFISYIAAKILKDGLSLLGIETIDKM